MSVRNIEQTAIPDKSNSEMLIQQKRVLQRFNQFLKVLEKQKTHVDYHQICEIYNLQSVQINLWTIKTVKSLHSQIVKRPPEHQPKRNWNDQELKVFLWTLFHYSTLKAKRIEDLGREDWEIIVDFFFEKTVDDAKFQWLLLLKSVTKTMVWTPQEDDLFVSLMKQRDFLLRKQEYCERWIDISKALYLQLQGKFKNPKQCRERWNNHLNPHLNKGEWTILEDQLLFKSILQVGKKWAWISRMLNNRTEHSVKNRYTALYNKYIKEHSIRIRSKCTKGMKRKQLQRAALIFEELCCLGTSLQKAESPIESSDICRNQYSTQHHHTEKLPLSSPQPLAKPSEITLPSPSLGPGYDHIPMPQHLFLPGLLPGILTPPFPLIPFPLFPEGIDRVFYH